MAGMREGMVAMEAPQLGLGPVWAGSGLGLEVHLTLNGQTWALVATCLTLTLTMTFKILPTLTPTSDPHSNPNTNSGIRARNIS